ncbi:MAG: B12-binding domain-containing radical SAM protein [Chitinophagales bacterium]|nr:B12-binding domain-containing radical SAM protein [Chitinophagales bacterium]
MKIVLALAPVWDSVTPHLALAFLKASVEKAGHECRCIDFSIQFRPIMVSVLGDVNADKHIRENPKLPQGWAKQICDEKPDIVGFSILGSNISNTALVAREVKKILPNVMIVSGGPSLTRENKESIITSLQFSDYVIEGEGEIALVDFINCYEQKGDFTKLKQVWMRDRQSGLYYTGHTALQNIDAIPYPDFTDFDRKLYPSPEKLPLLFSRGCILNCNYCENKWNHLTQRSRTGKNVFDELKHHVKKYGIKEYMFNDDSLISSKTLRQMDDYADLVLAEGLVMPWSVYGTRVERLITEEFTNKLRKTGMERLSLGVESFSSRVQKEMGKSSRYDDADRMCKMFANAGIKTESWIIYGYPTETDADFEETLNWFIQNPNVLSHVTANAFGPNAKYMHDRPGVVTNETNTHWGWTGLESTLQKRKKRFLQLIEVLESIRVARKGAFTYYFGDPLYVKYFKSWTLRDKEYLLKNWERLENIYNDEPAAKPSAIKKIFSFIGLKSVDQELKKSAEKAVIPEKLEVGDLEQMKEKLSKRIEKVLLQNKALSVADVQAKRDFYMRYIDEVKIHLNDNVTEEILYSLTLKGDVERMIEDIDTHAPEYLAQRVVEHAGKFIIQPVA